ncbi:MAG: aldo/keto reductase [Kiritimatiellae bacterium]|nr:aldo/keto reductase [Kiritimatiellia bacterium]
MEYTTFGNTGVEVSRLGFGGAPAGLKNYLAEYDPRDGQAACAIRAALEKAVELGITYFDSAPGYGDGVSERVFGDVLHGLDAEVFVATKVGPGRAGKAAASLRESLGRLRREYVDLLQIHGGSYSDEQASAILARGGMLEELEQLKRDGLVRFVGFTSEDNNPAVYTFIRSGRFDVMQICYNLIFQHPYEPSRPFGSLYEAERAGMGIVTMRTLTSGTFQRWVRQVNPADNFDYTEPLIQFVLSNPLVDVALIGMRTPEMVVRNAAICENRAGRIDLSRLHQRYVGEGGAAHGKRVRADER